MQIWNGASGLEKELSGHSTKRAKLHRYRAFTRCVPPALGDDCPTAALSTAVITASNLISVLHFLPREVPRTRHALPALFSNQPPHLRSSTRKPGRGLRPFAHSLTSY